VRATLRGIPQGPALAPWLGRVAMGEVRAAGGLLPRLRVGGSQERTSGPCDTLVVAERWEDRALGLERALATLRPGGRWVEILLVPPDGWRRLWAVFQGRARPRAHQRVRPLLGPCCEILQFVPADEPRLLVTTAVRRVVAPQA
jgi:hypothetical protein